MNILDKLKWRYATKKFDPQRKLTSAQLNVLLESVNLAATSIGLQPFKLIVVENEQVRKLLGEAARNQPQVTEASQVLVFAAKTEISQQYIDDYIQLMAKTRGVALTDLDGFKTMVQKSVFKMDSERLKNWTARQTYIALGFLLSTAAFEGIDACPMEGFDNEQFDEILDLKNQGHTAVVMATVGYRSDKDAYANLAKVRRGLDELMVYVK
jgi:nitroreductase